MLDFQNIPLKLNSKENKTIQILLILMVALFTGMAIYHIILQPYPNNWDDGWYTIHTHKWLSLIKERGFLRGLYQGYKYLLPGNYSPIVFFTTLLGALINETLTVMRLVHLVWFVVTLLAVYGTGSTLANGWIGILSAYLVASSGLIFYWGKTIMGEPSLFAFFALSLFLIIKWGTKITPLRGLIIGFILGIGLLSKQQFIILMLPPLAIWIFWLINEYIKEIENRARIIKSLAIMGFAAFITCIPWYGLHLKDTLVYITTTSREHEHNLISESFAGFIGLYIRNLFHQIGWPSLILLMMGIIYSIFQMISTKWIDIRRNWNIISILILLSSMITLITSIVILKNINTRFIATAFIPGGILTALALGDMWKRRAFILKIFVGGLLLFQLLYFINQSFFTPLPKYIKFIPQSSFMRPIDIEPLPQVIKTLKDYIPDDPDAILWIGGGNSHFNNPLVNALAQIDGQDINTESIYYYQTDEFNQSLQSIKPGDYILLYESLEDRPDLFTYYNYDSSLRSFDQFISNWIRSHPDSYENVYSLESKVANNRIILYRFNLSNTLH